jgi:hypothetical protein
MRYTVVNSTRLGRANAAGSGAKTWMPANAKCSYVTSWVAVKWRWRLAINTSEKTYLTRALASCGWPRIAVFKRATVHTTRSWWSALRRRAAR